MGSTCILNSIGIILAPLTSHSLLPNLSSSSYLCSIGISPTHSNIYRKKSILLKYRPTGFEAKWIYWFHLQPGVTKEIKTSEGQTIGVTKTNSISVEDSVTASVGFPIDIVSVKVEASTSKTTFDAVQRNVIKTYNKTVTDTYENKTKP